MLTNPQKSLIKRAQREAGLDDADYREALFTACHATSSTDARLGDRAVDVILAYFEAIYWRKVDLGELVHQDGRNRIFQQRHYWAEKNTKAETSRDRFTKCDLARRIENLEVALGRLGYGPEYCSAIREKVTHGATTAQALHHYRVALERTLASKKKARAGASPAPF